MNVVTDKEAKVANQVYIAIIKLSKLRKRHSATRKSLKNKTEKCLKIENDLKRLLEQYTTLLHAFTALEHVYHADAKTLQAYRIDAARRCNLKNPTEISKEEDKLVNDWYATK